MHLPSSLSHLYYLNYLFTNHIVTKNMNIIIGKPFGADAYYYIWKKLGWLDPSKTYSYGIKHEEIDFVDYSEETLGNALGIAAGICIGNKKKTWINLSDGALQMGPTLEAVQFIGRMYLPVIVTIDYNNMQLTGPLHNNISFIKNIFLNSGWIVFEIKEKDDFLYLKNMFNSDGPTIILMHTKKGDGVKEMEEDPVGWHYKKLKDINEITISEELKSFGFFTSLGYVE